MTNIVPTLKNVEITNSDGNFIVCPIWNDVDRPDTSGYSCGSNEKLARRLEKAFLAGAVYTNPHVVRDVNGKSYVNYTMVIRMRAANADLKRIGF